MKEECDSHNSEYGQRTVPQFRASAKTPTRKAHKIKIKKVTGTIARIALCQSSLILHIHRITSTHDCMRRGRNLVQLSVQSIIFVVFLLPLNVTLQLCGLPVPLPPERLNLDYLLVNEGRQARKNW